MEFSRIETKVNVPQVRIGASSDCCLPVAGAGVLIVANITAPVIHPTFEEIAILASIVVIRKVIS